MDLTLHRCYGAEWLPLASRIQYYKLCILMYDVYHGTAPSYLRELCHVCNDDRLRSTQCGNFSVVRTRTELADGAFTVAGPAAWNVLPSDFRNSASRTVFLSNLKTHLYNRHFHCIMGFKVFLDFLFIDIVLFHIW